MGPPMMVDTLEQLTADPHHEIHQRRRLGWARLKTLAAMEFPCAVRAHAVYVWIALAVFAVPTLVLGALVYVRPELILTMFDSATAADFERIYSRATDSFGPTRTAASSWQMFGFYICNNIAVAFQCFASGVFAGVGSLFFLAFNGALGGAVGGYLTERGLATAFYSFVVTHAAFELTALVLAGAAGLKIGHALLVPGCRTRTLAVVVAARESSVIIYGVTMMLLIAAAIEAFWSSATWIAPLVKYCVAAVCWAAVLGYLTLQGRRAG
jgi:uncharacterized membrane protein SpoIIM required for sporulation